jgi:hypothetical protein
VKVQLTRKLAKSIDDIDLSGSNVGDVIDLPERDAQILVAEGWALPADSPVVSVARSEAPNAKSRSRKGRR